MSTSIYWPTEPQLTPSGMPWNVSCLLCHGICVSCMAEVHPHMIITIPLLLHTSHLRLLCTLINLINRCMGADKVWGWGLWLPKMYKIMAKLIIILYRWIYTIYDLMVLYIIHCLYIQLSMVHSYIHKYCIVLVHLNAQQWKESSRGFPCYNDRVTSEQENLRGKIDGAYTSNRLI